VRHRLVARIALSRGSSVRGRLGGVARIAPTTLEGLSGSDDVASSLLGLAEALASSPAWSSMGPAVIAVRHDPEPLLAVLGELSDAAAARLDALDWQLGQASLQGLRFVGYGTAEAMSRRLAARLVERFERTWLETATFRAVPRGGHVVLGMLAYALDLRVDQLTETPRPGSPVVVVDDCSLSGARLRRFLRELPTGEPVVFAHLYSTPELRGAVEEAEDRVLACVAAHDLRDLAPELHGAGYVAWRDRWARRNLDDYWTGHPEPVCFAWNEPDVNVWNPVTGVAEAGWRLVPPDRCLKNAVTSAAATAVQACGRVPGPLGPGPDVVWAELGEHVIVARADDERALRLSAVAADTWRAIVETGALELAADQLAERYEVEPALLATDVARFVGELTDAGFLVPDVRDRAGRGAVVAAPPLVRGP
jgi:hypothetical protein